MNCLRYLSLPLALAVLPATVSCTMRRIIRVMPRDSGKVYLGEVSRTLGTGQGAIMTITIEGVTYTGPCVATSSDETVGFMQQYGPRGGVTTGMGVASTGSHGVKAILSSPEGRGLRCLFEVANTQGGGIAVDDKGKVFDVIVTKQ